MYNQDLTLTKRSSLGPPIRFLYLYMTRPVSSYFPHTCCLVYGAWWCSDMHLFRPFVSFPRPDGTALSLWEMHKSHPRSSASCCIVPSLDAVISCPVLCWNASSCHYCARVFFFYKRWVLNSYRS